MKTPTNRLFRLQRRPQGQVTEQDLEWVEESIPDIAEGQALIRTLYLSLDPHKPCLDEPVAFLHPAGRVGRA